MKTTFIFIVILSVLPVISRAEEDRVLCGNLSYQATRWFVDESQDGNSFWISAITGDCATEINPDALSPNRSRYLISILSENDKYVCIYANTSGACSGTSRINEVYKVSRSRDKLPKLND